MGPQTYIVRAFYIWGLMVYYIFVFSGTCNMVQGSVGIIQSRAPCTCCWSPFLFLTKIMPCASHPPVFFFFFGGVGYKRQKNSVNLALMWGKVMFENAGIFALPYYLPPGLPNTFVRFCVEVFGHQKTCLKHLLRRYLEDSLVLTLFMSCNYRTCTRHAL